jgi:hypothetical protein
MTDYSGVYTDGRGVGYDRIVVDRAPNRYRVTWHHTTGFPPVVEPRSFDEVKSIVDLGIWTLKHPSGVRLPPGI